MRSTIDFAGCATDCRSLTFGGAFYDLTKRQVEELTVDYQRFVNMLFGETCVLEWTFNGHAVKDMYRAFEESNSIQHALWLRGFVSNQTIYNKTTLREYCRKRTYSLSQSWAPMDTSVDYLYKKATYLGKIDLDEKTLETDLLTFFLIDSEYLNEYTLLDISGHVCIDPVVSHMNRLYGTLCLSVSFLCLGDQLDDIAETMGTFAEQLSDKYTQISLTVGIETKNHGDTFSDYLWYFGELCYRGYSSINHNVEGDLIKLAQLIYLTRIGWVNVLSPRAAFLKRQFLSTAKKDSVIVTKELTNGGLCVRSGKAFSACRMLDYAQLKSEVYGALYPGGIIIPGEDLNEPMNTYLRPRWECVPLLREEIHIENNSIRIQHCGKLNKELLSETLDDHADNPFKPTM